MLPFLPDEIISHVLLYTRPDNAHLLGKTCRVMRDAVKLFYQQNAATLVKPGGAWRHCVVSKRTRTSLSCKDQIISCAPMGVWSIVEQRCAKCHLPFKASLHKDFGIVAHAECIRPYLLNTYYLEKFGLKESHFESVPSCELKGYSIIRGSYYYTTLWKDKTDGIVPYEWTAHHLVHHACAGYIWDYREEQRQRRLAEEQAKKEQQKQHQTLVRALRNERMEKLIGIITTLDKKQVKRVIATKIPHNFLPDFFGYRNLEHNKFHDYDYQEAKDLILNAHRLLQDMTAPQIIGLASRQDLKKDFRQLCRDEAKIVLNRLKDNVIRRTSAEKPTNAQKKIAFNADCLTPGCKSMVSVYCLNRKCGKCCKLCPFHINRYMQS